MIDTEAKALLAADGTLTALLGSYKGAPAIFVHNLVPADYDRSSAANAAKAYVTLRDGERGPYLDAERDFFTQALDVLVLGLDRGDAAVVEAAADRVRSLLDGADLAPAGYSSAGGASIESGPAPEDPDEDTFGRRLRAVVGIIET